MKRRSMRGLVAVALIGLVATTGCSAAKNAGLPVQSSPAATTSSTPAVTGVDLTALDTALSQIDTQVSGANAGLKSTTEGDVQTR